jgi:small subunit ribosomal protein S8
MGMTDPISDLLTRMRNAIAMNHDTVHIPASNMKLRIIYLLREEGFIRNFKMINDDK